ncbi:unnamed protein product [Thelazia callipaeda]|uniref:NADH dehydrogenase [ubiquinone] 1 alpha subcomplex subunit 7 n=1 Tax=Thelazia callipaeda TaxID=103827 RepID=A0A0N5CW73_THECL|nr:unnamed protein product [Thelazia callipaeda]
MSKLPKIASESVVNRAQTPIIVWIRDKLNAIYRDRKTPPPGLPTADGESRFYEMNRFPKTQSARSRLPVSLPGGVHHKLSDNYYLDRDARHSVEPPKCVYSADATGISFKSLKGETLNREEVMKPETEPRKNFGLEMPTAGFGYRWHRNREDELSTPKNSKCFAALEKYDKHTYSN